jgi:hypothetical protein
MGGGTARTHLKRFYAFLALLPLPLVFAPISLPSTSFIPNGSYHVVPTENAVQTILEGKNWAFRVGFAVQHREDIVKLIQCESQGVNIARPDSNGLISWGILQFNGTSTWQDMEKRFNFYGSPMVPTDAIHMADMMIQNGYLYRWTCARILRLHTPR